MTAYDWPIIRAITSTTPPTKHSARCPCSEYLATIERCTCWVLNDAHEVSSRIGPIYARRLVR